MSTNRCTSINHKETDYEKSGLTLSSGKYTITGNSVTLKGQIVQIEGRTLCTVKPLEG